MKYIFAFTLLIYVNIGLYGQEPLKVNSVTNEKPPLDTSIFNNTGLGKWVRASWAEISHNGRYVFYVLYNQPTGRNTLVFRPINGEWEMKFPGAKVPVFTDDSKQAIFLNQHDSLCLITLNKASLEYISDVQSFEIWKSANREWIVYHLKTPDKRLVLRDVASGRCQYYEAVDEYWLHSKGNILVIKKDEVKDSINRQSLYCVNITDGNTICIWKASSINDVILDDSGTQLVFTGENIKGKSFWYYKTGTNEAIKLNIPQMEGEDSNLKVENIQRFSQSGKRLFVTLKEKNHEVPSLKADAVKSDVWSYLDVKLQSQQLHDLGTGELPGYTGVIDISNHKMMRLNRENEKLDVFDKDDWAIITKSQGGDPSEWYWNKTSIPSFYLVSTITDERKLLPINYPYGISPGGRYLIGTDSYIPYNADNLLSYDIETGQVHKLTHSLNIPLDAKQTNTDENLKHPRLSGAGAWLADDKALLVYDQYDIWQLDPSGKQAAVNLTNGYGRKNKIVFRLPGQDDRIISESEPLLLNAFNKSTKNNGLYTIVPENRENPKELLAMSAARIGAPKKARDTDVYIFTRETAAQSPNWFWTSDFKNSQPISNVYPEKKYNWLTSELITWKTFDGTMSSGILYKPENFDANKKYPVIFHYYEEVSDRLNYYRWPGTSDDVINIPWFVSNGYLVFMPDIHFKIGYTGQSAYNSVVSAAKYLSQFPWVDAKHMGIQGHSFGSYETNYIVTRTRLFAAAVTANGTSNMISFYGAGLFAGRTSAQAFVETGQMRMGRSPWQNLQTYIKESPIFFADKIETPLLMMYNKNDEDNYSQGIEFFTALRRLGKKAWMLDYDGEGHTIYRSESNKRDYTIRMTQFFDHYLKNAPAPRWMTRGIPASKKGIDYGLELDDEIKTPGAGLLK
jgi:dienelactone hydrolase